MRSGLTTLCCGFSAFLLGSRTMTIGLQGMWMRILDACSRAKEDRPVGDSYCVRGCLLASRGYSICTVLRQWHCKTTCVNWESYVRWLTSRTLFRPAIWWPVELLSWTPNRKGEWHFSEGRNITQEGSVLWDPTRHRIQEPDVLLRPGDICLRAIWSPATQLVCAQIPSAAPPLAAANTLIVLRRKEETTAEEWQVLVEFLQSPRAADLMAPRALGSIHLSHRALAELPVPVPDQALRVALRTLTDAAADFELWRRETERQKRALFSFAASQKGRLHLMQAGKRARQRQRAGKSVEALAFRVRTQYPHPLAYRWRTVEAGGQGLEDYQNVLDCAEATLCYLALLAVVGARSHRLSIGQLAQIGGRLTERNRGIGLGDWVAVLREVGTSTKFRDLNTFPFPEVPMVLTDDHTNDAVQRLLDARNDQAHGRGPPWTGDPDEY